MAETNARARRTTAKAGGTGVKKPSSENTAADATEMAAAPAPTAEPAEIASPDASVGDKQEKPAYKVKSALDPGMYVTVKNGFNGTLVYKSRKTGERFIWEAFGDEQEMELAELKNAKNSYKTFFVNNWFLFDDPEVVEWLGVGQYYKHALNFESFDKLFEKTPEEIEDTLLGLSAGQKKTVAFRAKQMITEGMIDSMRVINALEKCLCVELIER